MKKFLNQAENFIPEMLEGIYLAHPDKFRCVNEDLHCLATARPVPGKVGIVTGGGSGHLPLFLGYVGQGMLDGCAIGDVFQSPSPEQILAVTQAVDSGAACCTCTVTITAIFSILIWRRKWPTWRVISEPRR